MSSPILILVLGFAALLVLSGTFSGSETALFSLDRIQLKRFERSASRRERMVAAAIARPERLLAGILFGNTLVNVALSSVAVAITRRLEEADLLLGRDPVGMAVVLATAVVLVVGEIFPKGIAVHWPTRVGPVLILALAPLLWVIAPASRVLVSVARFLLGLIGVTEQSDNAGLGRRELRMLFEDIQDGKEITEAEGAIVSNVFTFFETRAYEVMTPRVDLVGIPVGLPPAEVRRRVIGGRHTRLPVYRGSPDQIIGFVNSKDFLLEPDQPLEALLRPVHFVPERARLHRILAEVQSRRLNLVVVVNEYGGTSGIITQEDIAEEVVGEIFDEQEGEEARELEQVNEDSWRAAGLLSLHDLREAMGFALPESPAETVAGHVAHLLGRPPRRGEVVRDGPFNYEVLQVRRHRAQRVLITWKRPRSGAEEDTA